jgi:ubiquinone/menaquinone biosynthesis C-methylase UbiE
MQRLDLPELLDSDACPPDEVRIALQDIVSVNRRFGGVSTTQAMIERVARSTGKNHFSLLEVAAASGEVPTLAAQKLARRGISLDITLLDRAPSHLRSGTRSLAADALALPFRDASFDLVSCNLFAHHLTPEQLACFLRESLRVSGCAVLINDLIRHPLHLALVYASFPLMRSRVAWVDGVASVRRAYVPAEIRQILSAAFPANSEPHIDIFRHYLFRMGVILWKKDVQPMIHG